MECNNTQVMNFKNAFRGMRNPLESWDSSDSFFGITSYEYDIGLEAVAERWVKQQPKNYREGTFEFFEIEEKYMDWLSEQGTLQKGREEILEAAYLGPKDLALAQKLIKAGSSDRKFMRQIIVSVDITAPLYWWKQFDTYKIGTVANSTSTMHKLANTPITKECFEMDDFNKHLVFYENEPYNPDIDMLGFWNMFINDLEYLRKKYSETKDKRYWKELIRILPESWLQTRTVTMNYEILRNIYSQRKNHKLTEWHIFCDWIKTLPYGEELITIGIDQIKKICYNKRKLKL